MNAVAKTDAEKWSDYAALQRAVDRLDSAVTDVALNLDRVSRLMPLETFPERRLSQLQTKVDDLAAELRRALADTARRREEVDDASARVDTLFAEAAE